MTPTPNEDSIFVPRSAQGGIQSFVVYLAGCLILIGGLIYAAVLLHVPSHWVAVCAIVLLGLAVLIAAKVLRHKNPPAGNYRETRDDEVRLYRR